MFCASSSAYYRGYGRPEKFALMSKLIKVFRKLDFNRVLPNLFVDTTMNHLTCYHWMDSIKRCFLENSLRWGAVSKGLSNAYELCRYFLTLLVADNPKCVGMPVLQEVLKRATAFKQFYLALSLITDSDLFNLGVVLDYLFKQDDKLVLPGSLKVRMACEALPESMMRHTYVACLHIAGRIFKGNYEVTRPYLDYQTGLHLLESIKRAVLAIRDYNLKSTPLGLGALTPGQIGGRAQEFILAHLKINDYLSCSASGPWSCSWTPCFPRGSTAGLVSWTSSSTGTLQTQ